MMLVLALCLAVVVVVKNDKFNAPQRKGQLEKINYIAIRYDDECATSADTRRMARNKTES